MISLQRRRITPLPRNTLPSDLDINDFEKKIEARYVEMIEQGGSQHISFSHVKTNKYHEIQQYRDQYAPKLLLTYLSFIETLIVKIPNSPHERLLRNFGSWLHDFRSGMGLPQNEFFESGSMKYKVEHNPPASHLSQKEGGSIYRNKVLRPDNERDWPHLVIEAGDSESFPCLKVDAKWWVENLKGKVLVVLVLKINIQLRTMRILKYHSISPPPSRYPFRDRPVSELLLVADAIIDHSISPVVIQGAPLVLEFSRVFGRNPSGSQEGDIILMGPMLATWAEDIW